MLVNNNYESQIKGHLADALFSIEKPSPNIRGKVREIFSKGDHFYMVCTDRISAFDHVLGTVPLKGALLCEQAQYWFSQSKTLCKNHLLDRPDPQILVCRKAQVLPVEVVVRQYLAGSLLREAPQKRGQNYGLSLDKNLRAYEKLASPIITPTTKAKLGEHDQPISAQEIVEGGLVDKKLWQQICETALALFNAASLHALERGLLLVDTKYEFGLIDGELHLVDEVHTSDSSRFFLQDDYQKCFGTDQKPRMLDKEFLRQHLIESHMVNAQNYAVNDIHLSDDLRVEVAMRYLELTERITGANFVVPKTGAHSRVHNFLAKLFC